MKSIPLNKFVPGYVRLIRNAIRKNEEILVTSKGLPFFIVTPVRPKVDYEPVRKESLRENPATFVRIAKKFKGQKVRTETFLVG